MASLLSSFRVLALLLAVALGPTALAPTAQAQTGEDDDLAEIIAVAGEEYVRGYAAGIIETSSAALGSALFFESGQANSLIGPFNLYVGVRGAATPFGSGERTFDLAEQSTGRIRLSDGTLTDVRYTYRVQDAPTALGELEAGPEAFITARYRNTEGEMTTDEFRFASPQGLLGSLPIVPTGVPQAGLGIPALGLRISARYAPTVTYDDAPARLRNAGVNSVQGSLWGIGARQSLDAWFEALPFELSVYGYYQHIGISSNGGIDQQILDFSMISGGLNFSKPIVEETSYAFSLFAGVGGETSTAHFTYEASRTEAPFTSIIDFNIEDPLSLRTRAGFSTRFGPLMINLGYAPLPRSTILGGVGISL